ncbi:hypothetical protein [Nitrospirillum amazonense]|uniref:Uncharacterized protein n=1 Tax=Nitrospirillum amazonense TaxID=28077 RepID=A0A560K9T0_9PROT|nr:hypothetical protein [Nitrospirillum amazonense]MDG3441541.1 hypothetical protein [Nitrospirillum amazonense]TWB79966.1 hypothetical protein FBZ87_102388 [Nitrospirillum amazonense]
MARGKEAVPETPTHEAPPPLLPTPVQKRWLRRGLDQAGGKLPLFWADGSKVTAATVKACLEAGWATPWFSNPLKPDWLVCRLTDAGRAVCSRTPARKKADELPATGETSA